MAVIGLHNVLDKENLKWIFISISKFYVENYQDQDKAIRDKMGWHTQKNVCPGFEKCYLSMWFWVINMIFQCKVPLMDIKQSMTVEFLFVFDVEKCQKVIL